MAFFRILPSPSTQAPRILHAVLKFVASRGSDHMSAITRRGRPSLDRSCPASHETPPRFAHHRRRDALRGHGAPPCRARVQAGRRARARQIEAVEERCGRPRSGPSRPPGSPACRCRPATDSRCAAPTTRASCCRSACPRGSSCPRWCSVPSSCRATSRDPLRRRFRACPDPVAGHPPAPGSGRARRPRAPQRDPPVHLRQRPGLQHRRDVRRSVEAEPPARRSAASRPTT